MNPTRARHGTWASRSPRPILLVAALTTLLLANGPLEASDPAPTTDNQAREVQSCLAAECHAYRMAFKQSPHSALDSQGLAKDVGASSSCAACHGEPIRRQKQSGEWLCDFETFAFNEGDLPAAKSRRCQTCHAGEHPGFASSEHARAGLACTDCHDVHGRDHGRWPLQKEITVFDGSALQSEAPSATCARCHSDVFAEFGYKDRHRLQEGIIQCTSCHDPHERQSRMALGGFNHERCGRCHTDKGGPYVFEHGSLRVEGCTACHSPHGSPNRHMLNFQAVAELCYSCHVTVPVFHTRFTLDSQCTNCHSSIHGSQLDPNFLR